MEQGPDLRLDPLLVSLSVSLESRYEESESDSSLLTSSELEGGIELPGALESFLVSMDTVASKPELTVVALLL